VKFVFVTDELPRPGVAGHLAMNHAIISWLRGQGHQVILLLNGARLRWPAERFAPRSVAGPRVAQLGGLVMARGPGGQLRGLAKAVLTRLPAKTAARLTRRRHAGADAVLGSFITPSDAAWCAAYIRAAAPDAILIDTIFRAPVLSEPGMDRCNSVIITHDLFHRRHAALASAGFKVQPGLLSRTMEAALLAPARSIAAIQPDEAAVLQTMCPGALVFTAAMPAEPCPPPAGNLRLAERLVFVGSASLPNLDGLRWFLEAVWPILRRWRPDVTLDLVGSCGGLLKQLPEGVNRLGQVAALAPVLHRAALAISPLRVGSGLKIKLLDYARHGLMTVATPASLAGFAAGPAAPFIAASNPAGFATAINRQLAAGPAGGDTRALDYARGHYGAATCFAGLRAALALPDDAVPRHSVTSPVPAY
jgi:hypothetical protein